MPAESADSWFADATEPAVAAAVETSLPILLNPHILRLVPADKNAAGRTVAQLLPKHTAPKSLAGYPSVVGRVMERCAKDFFRLRNLDVSEAKRHEGLQGIPSLSLVPQRMVQLGFKLAWNALTKPDKSKKKDQNPSQSSQSQPSEGGDVVAEAIAAYADEGIKTAPPHAPNEPDKQNYISVNGVFPSMLKGLGMHELLVYHVPKLRVLVLVYAHLSPLPLLLQLRKPPQTEVHHC